MRILRRLSAVSLMVAALLYVYFNVWHAAYYYPDRYEDAFEATFVALILGVLGLAGLLGVRSARRQGSRSVPPKQDP